VPSVLLESLPSSRAPLLHGHYAASPLLCAPPPPSRLPPFSWFGQLYGFPAPPFFLAGRGGLLQSLDMSLLPCCPYHPAGVSCRLGQPATRPCCLRPETGGSASGSKFCFEATCGFTFVTARQLAHHPYNGFVARLHPLRYPPRIRPKSGRRRRVCTLASVRLSNCTCGFPACSFHEDSRPPRCQKGIKGTFLAPIRLIQSTSLLGRGRTGFSQKELFRPPSSLLIWFPFSS